MLTDKQQQIENTRTNCNLLHISTQCTLTAGAGIIMKQKQSVLNRNQYIENNIPIGLSQLLKYQC